MVTTRQPAYRVEHHEQGQVQALGALIGVAPHHRSLDPFVSQLLRECKRGDLVLIDAGGKNLARRRVLPFKGAAWRMAGPSTSKQDR